MLAVVLLVAFLAAKSCGSRDTEIESEEAIEIARDEVEWEPERVLVRFVPRGFESRPYWAVSLSTLDEAGNVQQLAVVLVDARSGQVEQVDTDGGG
jgi:hypothetical protein